MGSHDYKRTDGGPIDEATARKWIARYKALHGEEAIRAFFLGADIIEDVLSNTEAVGLRIYLGSDEADKDQLKVVLVGTRMDGSNIWPSTSAQGGGGGGTIADQSYPCPPYCPNNDQ